MRPLKVRVEKFADLLSSFKTIDKETLLRGAFPKAADDVGLGSCGSSTKCVLKPKLLKYTYGKYFDQCS